MPTTPAAMGFSALVAITAFLFILWHTWHYDRFRCVVYSKRDWFRALMVQILLVAIGMFVLYTWIEAAILYDEYYTFVVDTTMPTPWQLWTEHHQKMWKASLYLLCTGWCFLQAVHLEEFLYWAYLMQGIRISGGPRWTWAKSPHFKVWIGVFACSWALLFGAVSIETTNLDMMKAYIFIVGSALSCVLACASIILCIVFPRFVRTVESQGANYEVLERLHFFAEMNQIRTFFRVIYSVAFLTLSVDAMTDSKKIYNSTFWSDILDVAGQMSIFCSTCLSVVILLPRNMTSESLPPVQSDNFHPMVPYKRPSATGPDGGFAQRQFYELGDRLNIDKDVLANSLKQEPSYEMKESPRGQYPPQTDSPPVPHTLGYKAGPRGTGDSDGVPHIVINGVENDRDDGDGPYSPQGNNIPLRVNINQNHGSRRYSQFSSLPNVMARFTSPIETGVGDREPSRVFVNTHHEVIRE